MNVCRLWVFLLSYLQFIFNLKLSSPALQPHSAASVNGNYIFYGGRGKKHSNKPFIFNIQTSVQTEAPDQQENNLLDTEKKRFFNFLLFQPAQCGLNKRKRERKKVLDMTRTISSFILRGQERKLANVVGFCLGQFPDRRTPRTCPTDKLKPELVEGVLLWLL